MRVTMIGAGYVGLVSGACFADFGHHVTCIDKDAAKIAALDLGAIPIFEPGLAELVEANVRQGRLHFAVKATGVAEADAVMIAVGTPSRRGDGHADVSFVFDAVRELAPLLSRTAIVVTKSTVPVGTGDEIERILREKRPDAEMQVVSNPEFLREGAAIQDFKHPDRIVVGTEDARARAIVAELYRPLYLNAAPILYVSRRTAELIKYASNAFLATKITFINEIADLCEQAGADVQDVARGMGLVSAANSFTPVRASAVRVSPRTRPLCSRLRTITAWRCASSRPSRRLTSNASAPWRARSLRRSTARSAARRLPCLASPSSRIPTTSATRRQSL
jgi:UDPglucose 6-dehydrogenase